MMHSYTLAPPMTQTTGASSLINYIISYSRFPMWKDTTTLTVAPQATMATISHLTKGTPYVVSIRAVNAQGAGPDSRAGRPRRQPLPRRPGS